MRFLFWARVGVPYFIFYGLPISLGTLHRNKWNWKSMATWIHVHNGNLYVFAWKFCVWTHILSVSIVFPCKVPKKMGRLWNLKSNSYTCVYGQYRIIACMGHWARTYLPCAQLAQGPNLMLRIKKPIAQNKKPFAKNHKPHAWNLP
jgi:hypothetical protein